MGLIEEAQDLYAVVPAEFTARRNAAATSLRASDREQAAQVRALPKPSVAAWMVNHLVRQRPQLIGAAFTLGGRLAAAQGAFDGPALRTLAKEQQSLLADLRRHVAEAAEQAGQSLGDATVAQVESTVRAAMADPAAARVVASGVLVRDLRSTGLEPVDLTGAVALEDAPALLTVPEPVAHTASAASAAGARPAVEQPARPRQPAVQDAAEQASVEQADAARVAERQREGARRAHADARARLAAAEQATQEADRALLEARTTETALAERSAALTGKVDELTRRLEALRDELSTLHADQRRAREVRKDAARAARAAQHARSSAGAALERLPAPAE